MYVYMHAIVSIFTFEYSCFCYVIQKYADCDMDNENFNWEPVDYQKIEIEVESGTIRTEEDEHWLAEATNVKPWFSLTTVDQSGYSLQFSEGSETLIVTGTKFGADLTYTLPGFNAPPEQDMYAGVISFYSEVMERLFLVYPTMDSSYAIASCVTDDQLTDSINVSITIT